MFSLTTSFINKNFTFLPPSGSYYVNDMMLSGFYPEAVWEKFYGGVSGNLEGVLVNVSFVKVTKNTVIKIRSAVSGFIFVLVCIYIGSAIFSALEPAHWISRYFGAGAGLLFAYMWLSEFNGITLKRRSIFEGLLIKCDFSRRFPAQTYILSKPVSENLQSAVNKIVFAGGGKVRINDKFFSDKFAAYSADPEMADRFLSGMAAEGFSVLMEYFGEGANFSFNGSFLYISLPQEYSGIMPCFNRKDLLGSLVSFYGSISGILNALSAADLEKRFWNNI